MGRKPKSLLKDSHPHIAAQVVDKSLLPTLATGSDRRIEWEDEYGHRWWAKVFNRTNAKNPTGCPICAGRQILVGFNDLATTYPDVAKLCADPNDALTHTAMSNKKLTWRCEHGHTWVAPVTRLTQQGSRCPYCSGRYTLTGQNDLVTKYPDLAAELVDSTLGKTLKPGSNRKVEWRCSKCGYVWKATPYSRTGKGSGCPCCSGRVKMKGKDTLAVLHPELVKTMVHPEVAETLGCYSDSKVEWICEKNSSHRWYSTPGNRIAGGCPICANKLILAGENDLATLRPDVASQLVDKSLAHSLSVGSGRSVEWECEQGHRWFTTVYSRTKPNPYGCPFCSQVGKSKEESDLADVVKQLVGDDEVIENDRDLLPGRFELDILVPSRHMAFEFNGLRWHNEQTGKTRSYHKDKFDMCAKLGYQLVQVWEDDWRDRRNVVIRMIAHKLHASDRLSSVIDYCDVRWSERLYARKLVLQEVDGTQANRFFEENHIQGRVNCSRYFALVDNQKSLRAVLAVRSPRFNARIKSAEGEWEIRRYATCGTVVGGFTRLMAYAERTLLSEGADLRAWVSFSSNDISDGSMYKVCGFVHSRDVAPDYRYVGNYTKWRRRGKEQFQRRCFRENDALMWDESWTESRAAKENGLYRVWDAGKVRWIRNVSCSVS